MPWTFNYEISLGEIVETLLFVSAMFASWFGLKAEVAKIKLIEEAHFDTLSFRLNQQAEELKRQTDILVQLGAQKVQMDGLSQRVMFLEQQRMEK